MREEAAELIRIATGSSSAKAKAGAKKNLDLRPEPQTAAAVAAAPAKSSALHYHPIALLDEKVTERVGRGREGIWKGEWVVKTLSHLFLFSLPGSSATREARDQTCLCSSSSSMHSLSPLPSSLSHLYLPFRLSSSRPLAPL
jgi:hypothetical protein